MDELLKRAGRHAGSAVRKLITASGFRLSHSVSIPGKRLRGKDGADVRVHIDTTMADRPLLCLVRPAGVGEVDWERYHKGALPTGPAMESAAERVVTKALAPYLRLRALERAIDLRRMPYSERPAWTFSIGQVPLRVLQYGGFSPERIVDQAATPDFMGRKLRPGKDDDLIQNIKADVIGIDNVHICARKISLDDRVKLIETPARLLLRLDWRLPEMVLAGLKGRQLRDVVSHPALDGLDLPILRLARHHSCFDLEIPNVLTTLAPAPGRSWITACGGRGTAANDDALPFAA